MILFFISGEYNQRLCFGFGELIICTVDAMNFVTVSSNRNYLEL